ENHHWPLLRRPPRAQAQVDDQKQRKQKKRQRPPRSRLRERSEREVLRRCTTSASRSPTGSRSWPAACWATSAAAAPPHWRAAPAWAGFSSWQGSSASRPSRSAATPTSPSHSRPVRSVSLPPISTAHLIVCFLIHHKRKETDSCTVSRLLRHFLVSVSSDHTAIQKKEKCICH
uniref:Uncharacterized protein n=1 Tax=Triticum urartu TaxID=4572 RepID=A0A8R7QYD1_TRIUA